jgi:hypothetical protein
MSYDCLTFIAAERTRQRRISYWDFAVNGRPLREIVNPGDFIGVFGWQSAAIEKQFFVQLLGREPSELSSGRVPIYICPECADLGCGCLSIKLTKSDEAFAWSEFNFENNYETPHDERALPVPTFVFHKSEYYQALNRFGFE